MRSLTLAPRHAVWLCAAALFCAGSGAALAEPAGASSEPPLGASLTTLLGSRFVDEFADPDGELIEVNLPGTMLQGLAKGMAAGEPDAARAIGGLSGVNAVVLTVKAERVEEATRRVRALSDELIAKGWNPIARVRDKESTVTVLTGKGAGEGTVDGLVVLVFDRTDRELVVCHIAGSFDLAQLGALTRTLDIPGLDAVDGTANKP